MTIDPPREGIGDVIDKYISAVGMNIHDAERKPLWNGASESSDSKQYYMDILLISAIRALKTVKLQSV